MLVVILVAIYIATIAGMWRLELKRVAFTHMLGAPSFASGGMVTSRYGTVPTIELMRFAGWLRLMLTPKSWHFEPWMD
jgi:hypothetical protein